MKKIIVICLLMLALHKSYGQNDTLQQQNMSIQPGFISYADTANYLTNEIVGKKSLFIGKSFSVLMDSLKIQPTYTVIGAPPPDSLKGGDISIYFNKWTNVFRDKHYLIIYWQHPRPSWDDYWNVKRSGVLQDLLNLYRSVIIKDVDIKDYNEPDPEDNDDLE